MANLKQLFSQTIWYGFSNIFARLLTYLLTPYFTYIAMTGQSGNVEFGKLSFIYILFPFVNVLYTYGMETTYFRFARDAEDKLHLFRTQFTMMLLTTIGFTIILFLFQKNVAQFAEVADTPRYITYCAIIIALDAIATLPFAKLRQENRPRKYAFIKVLGILIYVLTIVFLFSFGQQTVAGMGLPLLTRFYENNYGLGFVLFANVLQSSVILLCLFSELKVVRLVWDRPLQKRVLKYGLPILIAGFAGTINDTLNRLMFVKMYPAAREETLRLLGYFSAAIRLSIMISLAIQAFKMAAEPFFFSISKNVDAKENYARVMKWFVIVIACMFLNIVLFMDIWQNFVGPEYRSVLYLVPILLLSYFFLGVYYNLTIWYKLTDQTKFGAYIMLVGAAVTVVFNLMFIKTLGYVACAISMFLSNGLMMVLSYVLGQKHYPVPYDLKRLGAHFVVMLSVGLLGFYLEPFLPNMGYRIGLGAVLFSVYLLFVYKMEVHELRRILKRNLS